jgi:hypothetical protein
MTNDTCLEGLRDRVNIYEEVTGQMLGCDAKRVEEEFGGSIDNIERSSPDLVAAKKICRDKFLAVAFIEHTDKKRYANLQTSLSIDYLRKKTDEYPDTLVHAAEIQNKWKATESRGPPSRPSPMFLQQGDSDNGSGVGRGGDGGGQSGRGRGGRGGGSKPKNATSENLNPYMCVPNREIERSRKSDSQLAE